jgi:hypothetical protein
MYEARSIVLDLRSDKDWSMWLVVIRKGGVLLAMLVA